MKVFDFYEAAILFEVKSAKGSIARCIALLNGLTIIVLIRKEEDDPWIRDFISSYKEEEWSSSYYETMDLDPWDQRVYDNNMGKSFGYFRRIPTRDLLNSEPCLRLRKQSHVKNIHSGEIVTGWYNGWGYARSY